jgi:hypothetical protein
MPLSSGARRRLAMLGGLVVVAIAAFVGIKLVLSGPPPSSVVSIISDFPVESDGPTFVAFDAVQSNVERFGATPATKEYITTIHAGPKSNEVACFVVSAAADGTPARFLLEVDKATMQVAVSVDVAGAWQPSAGDRAERCERLEPPS